MPSNHKANPNGQAPTETVVEDFPLQLLYDANGATLEEDIRLSYSGKEKTITKGNGDTVDISPNLKGTLTDYDSGDTFDFVMTGTIHRSDNGDGTTDVTLNGLNLTGNPHLDADNDGELSYALTQTRGHFYYTEDPGGQNFPEDVFSPLEGNGQILYIVDNFDDFV